MHLESTVPLVINEYLTGQRQLVMPRGDLAEYLAYNGDAIIYRTPKRTAQAVSALTEALASLAFCPGGVKFLGLHFEVSPEQVATVNISTG